MDSEELRNQLVVLQNENSRLKFELKDSEAEVELTQKQLARFQSDQGRVDSRMKLVGDHLDTRGT
jgi:predicted nuclease with TOPRIM domain